MNLRKFRKRPITIEAIRVEEGNLEEVARWCNGTAVEGGVQIYTIDDNIAHANFGWWVIRGVKGEFYPCEPGVFAATYEEAGDA